ncbi:S46 family peptidase [Microbulbifer spongiae]|uniref:Dipeptidyl-peptidase n=1 Tax=Microbulbifer spongiae TaxID=2944933 RepID=A0ABY9EB93_9GAMM|nr:S46 family peptidase [Microbulbifer sp. MI-G]WKD49735.1 S46 family peptidase [Microbulbifer sp. MI-G]
MKIKDSIVFSVLATALLAGTGHANAAEPEDSVSTEGMWQPHQLPELSQELRSHGLKLNPDSMTKLTEFPMNAVISLGGCSASFVSPTGLVITNHHCAYGSISYNSTESQDLLAEGFLAKDMSEELPAAPGSRVYVTVSMNEVTDKVNDRLNDKMDGAARFAAIEDAKKSLVSECEEDPGHRCEVYSYYGGLNYYLIKQLEIRDVRLVHAPASSIGKFGGDIDNWMWPRHTGDYAFYRAYVGKDGKPADYSKDNVPYKPKHYLPVAAKGPVEGDFVMVAGYPGRTNRYRTAQEVQSNFSWYYPTMQRILGEWSETIAEATAENKDAELKYASRVAGLNNYSKNFTGMMEGYQRSDLLQRKHKLEKALQAWVESDETRQKKYQSTLDDLKALVVEKESAREQDLALNYMDNSAMLGAARQLYRLAKEGEKPDAERKRGYQERDLTRFTERMRRIERSFDASVDKQVWLYFLQRYQALPKEERIASFDQFLNIGNDRGELNAALDKMYRDTELSDVQVRESWIGKKPEDFAKSKDPFIQLAVAMYDDMLAREKQEEALQGRFAQLRPQYMALLIDYYHSLGKPVYPDANSSLRLTYGLVKGYQPPAGTIAKAADGNDGKQRFVPFTTLRGIKAKYTGEAPFDAPKALMEAIDEKNYGRYYKKQLDSIPVNFLSTVDITGGNSGSPTMNGRGELVGVVFDGTYDSINADWDFTNNTRAIHVDIAYILWVMEHIDGAGYLVREMGQ